MAQRWFSLKHTNGGDARRCAAERLWLQYYNRTLLDRGLITAAEHSRMEARIRARQGGGAAR